MVLMDHHRHRHALNLVLGCCQQGLGSAAGWQLAVQWPARSRQVHMAWQVMCSTPLDSVSPSKPPKMRPLRMLDTLTVPSSLPVMTVAQSEWTAEPVMPVCTAR